MAPPDTPDVHDSDSTHEVMLADEVAELLRLSPAQVRRLARDGELPARRIGGTWRFSRTAITALFPVPAA